MRNNMNDDKKIRVKIIKVETHQRSNNYEDYTESYNQVVDQSNWVEVTQSEYDSLRSYINIKSTDTVKFKIINDLPVEEQLSMVKDLVAHAQKEVAAAEERDKKYKADQEARRKKKEEAKKLSDLNRLKKLAAAQGVDLKL